MKLDGTETPKPVPFDAHEQIVRQSHEHTADGPVVKEYEHQEFPKAIAHTEAGEPVIANDAAHEAELNEAKEE